MRRYWKPHGHSLPENRATVAEAAPLDEAQGVLVEIGGVVDGALENDNLESRDKRVWISVIVPPQTESDSSSPGLVDSLVVGRQVPRVIRRRVDDGPEGSIHNQVEDRRIAPPIDAAVEVPGADEVLCTGHGVDDVAELTAAFRAAEGEGADGGENWIEAGQGEGLRDTRRGVRPVRKPDDAVNLDPLGSPAIDGETCSMKKTENR